MAFVVGEVSAPVSADPSKFNQAMDDVKKAGEKTANAVSDSFTKLSKKMETIGKSLSKYVTAPLMGAGILASKSAIDFESAFAGVRKTVDATEAEFAALEQGIRDMAMTLPSGENETAGVAEAAGQLGIKNENILSFTRTMIDLGEATNLSADQAATSLARFANITQMSQTEFDRLGSTIVALGNNLATTEAEIVDMAMGLAGAGKQIGLTEAQIMGIAAALSSVGIEAQAGGSAFSRVLSQMQLAVETGNESLKDFAAVAGMTAAEFSVKFREDAAGALVEFIKGLGAAQEQGISSIKVLEDMGISEIRLRDALLRTSGAGDLLAESIALSTQAWDDNQALTKEAEQRYATMASQLRILKNNVTELAIQFGEIMVPWIQKASEKVKALTEWFQNLSPAMKENILRWAAIAAAIGPVLIIGSKIITLIKGIGTALTWLSANPMSMVAFGIGLLISAGISLWKNWDTIKLKASVLWDHLRVGFAKMVNWIIEKINYLIEKVNKIPGINIERIEELDTTRRVFDQTQEGMFDYTRSMDYVRGTIDDTQSAIEGLAMTQEYMADSTSLLTSNLLDEEKALQKVKKAAEEVKKSMPTPDDLRWEADLRAVTLQLEAGHSLIGGSKELMEALRGTVEDYSSAVADISRAKGVDLGVARSMLDADLLSKYQAKELIPHFAEGGVVYHPTLAMVGEKEPEVILPMSRLGLLNQPIHITENIYIYGNPKREDIIQGLDSGNNKLIRKLKLASPGVRI